MAHHLSQDPGSARSDLGFSHVALDVRDVLRSIAFYERFAGLVVVHRRGEPGHRVAWLSDLKRPFAIVLVESESHAKTATAPSGVAHLGVGCVSRETVDRLCERAAAEGCLALPPRDAGRPAGYFAMLRDPDGYHLELSYGQEVGVEIERAVERARADAGKSLPEQPSRGETTRAPHAS